LRRRRRWRRRHGGSLFRLLGSPGLAALLAIGCKAEGASPAGVPSPEAGRMRQSTAESPGSAAAFGPERQAALQKARILYERGEYTGAFDAAKKALTSGKESAEAYSLISRIYIDAAQDRQATEFFSIAAKQFGSALGWYHLGYHLFRLNRWDEAAVAFRKAAQLDPSNAECRFRQGLVLQAQGNFAGAVAALEKARDLDPASPLYAARVARLHRITGDYAAAARVVSEALARSPDNGELLYASAQMRLRDGKTAEAEALLRRSVEKEPDLREAHYDLARVLYQKGDSAGGDTEQRLYRRLSDYTEGLQSLSAKIASRPGDASLLLTVADMHLTERRWAEAVRTLARADAAGADKLRLACSRAEAHYGSGAPALGDEDVAAAERARGGGSSDVAGSARLALARAAGLVAHRDAAVALPLLSRAAGPDAPSDKLFLIWVADAYRDLGHTAEAEAIYRRSDALARPE